MSAPPLDGATLPSSPYVKQDDGDAAPLLKGREFTIAPLAELAPAFAAEAGRVAEIATWNREHPELLKEGFTRPLAESRAVSLDESTINAAKVREDVSGGRLAESGTGSVVGLSTSAAFIRVLSSSSSGSSALSTRAVSSATGADAPAGTTSSSRQLITRGVSGCEVQVQGPSVPTSDSPSGKVSVILNGPWASEGP